MATKKFATMIYQVDGVDYTDRALADSAALKWFGVSRGDVNWIDATTMQDYVAGRQVLLPGSASYRAPALPEGDE